MGRAARLGVLAVGAFALAACGRNMGARGTKVVALDQARTAPVQYWAYQETNVQQPKPNEARTDQTFKLGDQTFVIGYENFQGPMTMLRQVGSTAGATVYALSWDQPPYDMLVVGSQPDRMQVAEDVFH